MFWRVPLSTNPKSLRVRYTVNKPVDKTFTFVLAKFVFFNCTWRARQYFFFFSTEKLCPWWIFVQHSGTWKFKGKERENSKTSIVRLPRLSTLLFFLLEKSNEPYWVAKIAKIAVTKTHESAQSRVSFSRVQ